MKKLLTIIKFKENQLADIQKKISLKEIQIEECRSKISSIQDEIGELKEVKIDAQCPELFSIIDSLYGKYCILNNEIKERLNERDIIFSEFMIKKQEIKSLEMLVEKKKEELHAIISKREQDYLDEMNALE